MPVKKKKFKSRVLLGPKFLILEIAVLVIVILIAIFTIFFVNLKRELSKPVSTSAPVLTNVTYSLAPSIKPPSPSISPSPTPTKTPFVSPQHFGHSVNVPILMYHYIGNNPNPADKARNSLSTSPDVFDQQMGYLLSSGFTPVTLDTLFAALKGGHLPPKPIVLTFDDGYIDFYVNAYPILKKYNFHAVSFIPTSLISQGYYMSWSQIKEIQASGLVAFEAHSLSHPDLTSLSSQAEKDQIVQSKKILESEVGTPVNFFAYPYGISNGLSWKYAKEAGYFGAVGTWLGYNENEGNIYNMPRVRIFGGLSLKDFATKL